MLEVEIEKIVFGGAGLARTKSGVVLVPGALPGEVVKVDVQSKKKGVSTGLLNEIVKKSIHRRLPPCEKFGECGGCDWLFINPEFQLQLKKEVYQECFMRIGKINDLPDIELFSSPDLQYRTRAQIQLDDNRRAGFCKKKSNTIIQLDSCPLLVDHINSLFKHDYNDNAFNDVHQIKAVYGDTTLASSPVIPGLSRHETKVTVNNKVFTVTGEGFFQSNRFLNGTLGVWAKPFVGGDFCIDLYGGSGFFGLMLCDVFNRGLLVEADTSLAKKARENFSSNEVTHFKSIASTAEKLLAITKRKPDLIIVDPPRSGLTKQVREIIKKLKPRQLLYISCNIATQARDTSFFIHDAGYSIAKAALFDCYPNTYHIESALLFAS